MMCTLINRVHRETCEACGSPKPVHEIDIGNVRSLYLFVKALRQKKEALMAATTAKCFSFLGFVLVIKQSKTLTLVVREEQNSDKIMGNEN